MQDEPEAGTLMPGIDSQHASRRATKVVTRPRSVACSNANRRFERQRADSLKYKQVVIFGGHALRSCRSTDWVQIQSAECIGCLEFRFGL
jgi:hypothetical protein